MGYEIVDPILSVVIALVIVNTGISILLNNIKILLDANVIDSQEIEKCVMAVDGVEGISNIRTRGTQSTVFLEFGEIKDMVIEIDT